MGWSPRFLIARRCLAGSLLAAAACVTDVAAVNAAARLASSTRSYYLALGDSVPVWNGTRSYPYRIVAHYQRRLHRLTLDDIAVAGATTASMLRGSQYRTALQFLRAHRGHVALITIDIGGNDLAGCVGVSGIDRRCATHVRASIKRNLGEMLAGLRAAAPHAPLIGMTYYNPFLGDWLAGGAARSFTLSTVEGLAALNHELTRLYGGAKKTADVQGAFKATDFSTKVPSRWGTIPIAVERACLWLDIVCNKGALEGLGEHPNLVGAARIAHVFERTIGRLRA